MRHRFKAGDNVIYVASECYIKPGQVGHVLGYVKVTAIDAKERVRVRFGGGVYCLLEDSLRYAPDSSWDKESI